MTWMNKLLAPPIFEDAEKTRTARMLHAILLFIITFMVITAPLSVFSGGVVRRSALNGGIFLIVFTTLLLTRRGHLKAASVLFTGSLWSLLTLAAYTGHGVHAPAFSAYTLIIVISGLLLGRRAVILSVALSMLSGVYLAYAETRGLLPNTFPIHTPFALTIIYAFIFLLMAVVLELALQSIRDALSHAHEEVEQRKMTEQAQRQSEERYRTFLRLSAEGVSRWEHDAPIPTDLPENEQITLMFARAWLAEYNETFAQMYGFETTDDLIGTRLSALLPPTDPANHEYLRLFIRSGYRLSEIESSERDREGNIRLFLNNFVGIVEDGRLHSSWGTQRDITERKKVEEALREQQETTERFSEQLKKLHKLSIELSRADSLDTLCRRAVERARSDLDFDRFSIWLYNNEADQLRGTYGTDEQGNTRDEHHLVWTMFAPWQLEFRDHGVPVNINYNAPLRNVHEEEIARGWNMTVALRDGENLIGVFSVDNLLRRKPLQESQIELLGLYGAMVGHLCLRKQADTALKEKEAEFSTIFHTTPDAITLTRFDDGTFLDVNQSFTTHSGYLREEAIGKTSAELNVWKNPSDRDLLLSQLHEKGQVDALEAEFRRKDGSCYTGLLAAKDVEVNGERCILVINRDITEHKKLEEQLRQSQKLEGIGQLAGGIAHDFNNLLTAISGYTELAQEEIAADTQAAQFLTNVQMAAERAATLTRQLLTYARRQVVEFRSLNLNEVIMDMDALLQRTIGEHYELVYTLSVAAWNVYANTSQMEQVLLNLVVNARDAMPDGGRIIIETTNVTLDDERVTAYIDVVPGDYMMLSVSDAGAGMSAEVQTHIFEPFFTTKEIGKGTGLGLATCYGIVKQSKGNISVYSEMGHGTIFKVYLPRQREATVRERAIVPEVLLPGTETILLVDDEPMVRDIAARILCTQGYQVLEASNGQEALQLQEKQAEAIDLLITDVVMPLMSGKELAKRMIEKHPGMKVLYMSGYTQNVIQQQGVVESDITLIPKPFSSEFLLQKVREVLDAKSG